MRKVWSLLLLAGFGVSTGASLAFANQYVVVGQYAATGSGFGYSHEEALAEARLDALRSHTVIALAQCQSTWATTDTERIDRELQQANGQWFVSVTRIDTISCLQEDVYADPHAAITMHLEPYEPAHWEQQVQYAQTGVWQEPVW